MVVHDEDPVLRQRGGPAAVRCRMMASFAQRSSGNRQQITRAPAVAARTSSDPPTMVAR